MWYFIDDTLVLKFSTRDTLFRLYRSIYTHGVGIFVTGAGGFIGGHLIERLVELNAGQIVAMDNFHRPCIGDAPDFFHGVKFLQADVRDHSALLEGMRGSKVVFHLAAQSSVMDAVYDANYTFSSNVAGTFNVLRAAASAGVKRVVFTSSREVYGDPKQLPVRESSPIRPKNGYGASKAAGEVYCRAAANDGLETVILRVTNVYGTRDRDRVVPLFARSAGSGSPLTLYGGKQVLDFVWIDTVVDALVKVAFGPWIRGPMNIGSGKGVTVSELARRIVQLTGSSSPIHNVGRREQEVSRFVADIALAKKELGITEPEDPLWRLPDILSRVDHPVTQMAASGARFSVTT